MTEPRPACDGHYQIFWALIDTPGNPWIREAAAEICGGCELRNTCLPKHLAMGGEDAHWAGAVTKELARPKDRPCEYCGKTMQLKLRGTRRKRYCDDVCGHQARALARGEDTETGLTMPWQIVRSDLPGDVLEGFECGDGGEGCTELSDVAVFAGDSDDEGPLDGWSRLPVVQFPVEVALHVHHSPPSDVASYSRAVAGCIRA